MNAGHLPEYGDGLWGLSRTMTFQLSACRSNDILNQKVAESLRELCGDGCDWGAIVSDLSATLQMNKLELVCWMQIVKKALLDEPVAKYLETITFSAYLAKSLLRPDQATQILRMQDPVFKAQFEFWLCTHQHCARVSMRQLHQNFLELSLPEKKEPKQTLNRVVDNIMQVDSEKTPDTRIHEARPAPLAPVLIGKLKAEDFSYESEPSLVPAAVLIKSLK